MSPTVTTLDQLDYDISVAYIALGVARRSCDRCPSGENDGRSTAPSAASTACSTNGSPPSSGRPARAGGGVPSLDHMAEGSRWVAIVTGSESGIGRAIAVALAERGCDVGITWYRDEDHGRRHRRRGAGRWAAARRSRHLDLTRLPEAADVVDDLADTLGGVDVLVNAAGTGHSTPAAGLDLEHLAGGARHRPRRRVPVPAAGGPPDGRRRARRPDRQHHQRARAPAARRARPPTAPPRAGSGCSPRSRRWSWPSTASPSTPSRPGEIATAMTGQEDEDPTHRARTGPACRSAGPATPTRSRRWSPSSPRRRPATSPGRRWAVDGGMLQMGPLAGSHLRSDDWRRP